MDLTVPLPDVLTRRADGEIVVAGTRVTLYLWDFYRRHYGSAGLLRDHFPHLPDETHAALAAFCDAYPAEMSAFRTAYAADMDRLRATTGQTVDLEDLRRRIPRRQAPAA